MSHNWKYTIRYRVKQMSLQKRNDESTVISFNENTCSIMLCGGTEITSNAAFSLQFTLRFIRIVQLSNYFLSKTKIEKSDIAIQFFIMLMNYARKKIKIRSVKIIIFRCAGVHWIKNKYEIIPHTVVRCTIMWEKYIFFTLICLIIKCDTDINIKLCDNLLVTHL